MTKRSSRPDFSIGSKEPKLLIRSLDRTEIFTHVSGGRNPWCIYAITTRRRGGVVGPN
jgi:hypothetical protein